MARSRSWSSRGRVVQTARGPQRSFLPTQERDMARFLNSRGGANVEFVADVTYINRNGNRSTGEFDFTGKSAGIDPWYLLNTEPRGATPWEAVVVFMNSRQDRHRGGWRVSDGWVEEMHEITITKLVRRRRRP